MAKARTDGNVRADNPAAEPIDRYPADRVAVRAYELYLARGGSDGQDFDDWLAAERDLSPGPFQSEPKE